MTSMPAVDAASPFFARSHTSQPALRVITFQLLVSETSLVNLSRSRRMTLKIVDLASPANGLTGLITAVLIRIPSQRSDRPRTLIRPGRRPWSAATNRRDEDRSTHVAR